MPPLATFGRCKTDPPLEEKSYKIASVTKDNINTEEKYNNVFELLPSPSDSGGDESTRLKSLKRRSLRHPSKQENEGDTQQSSSSRSFKDKYHSRLESESRGGDRSTHERHARHFGVWDSGTDS